MITIEYLNQNLINIENLRLNRARKKTMYEPELRQFRRAWRRIFLTLQLPPRMAISHPANLQTKFYCEKKNHG